MSGWSRYLARKSSIAEFDATGQFLRLKGLTLDITERKQSEERQGLLIAELDHRVKNLLARVAVISSYTRQGSNSMDQFVQVLDRRIQSMAAAHSLLKSKPLERRQHCRSCSQSARSLRDHGEHNDRWSRRHTDPDRDAGGCHGAS